MRIGITGGSGFIGQAFIEACPWDDVQFVRFVRPAVRAGTKYAGARHGEESAMFGVDIDYDRPYMMPMGSEMVFERSFEHHAGDIEPIAENEIHVAWQPDDPQLNAEAVEGLDAMVHLAGENITKHRWNESFKQQIIESRVDATHFLSEQLASLDSPPKVFISASGVGFYGDRGDEIIDESAERGDGFLAHVAEEWEAAAEPLVLRGVRTAFARFGMVLGTGGGAIPKMLIPFRLGLGGKIGSGRQFVSWIDVVDAACALWHIIIKDSLHGPINITSPSPVRNQRLAKSLASTIHRPAIIPAERHAVKLLLGEMAEELLLSSQRAIPHKLLDAGFNFQYPEIEESMQHILGKETK